MADCNTVQTRTRSRSKYRWNAHSVFKSSTAWKTESEAVGRPGCLRQVPGPACTRALPSWRMRCRRCGTRCWPAWARSYVYASVSHSVDTTDEAADEGIRGSSGLAHRLRPLSPSWNPSCWPSADQRG